MLMRHMQGLSLRTAVLCYITYLAVFLIEVTLAPMIGRAVAVGAGAEHKLDVGSSRHKCLQSNHYTEELPG